MGNCQGCSNILHGHDNEEFNNLQSQDKENSQLETEKYLVRNGQKQPDAKLGQEFSSYKFILKKELVEDGLHSSKPPVKLEDGATYQGQ